MYEETLQAFERYLIRKTMRPETRKTYLRLTKTFLDTINKQPKNINKNDFKKWETFCTAYTNDSDKRRFNNNSLTPMYSAVKKYIEFLVDEEILDESMDGIVRRRLKAPKLKFDENDISHLVMQPDEFSQAFELAKKKNPMHYAMFKTMFWCMLRRCEVIGLKFSDIDVDNKKLHIRGEIAKGGKEATINIAEECIEILEEYRKIRDTPKKKKYEDIIFLRDGYPVSKTKMYEIHKLYSETLGFYMTSHMWRHTGITEYAKVEKDVKLVQKQARHDDINITMRYINYASKTYDKSYHEKFAKQLQKPELQKPKTQRPDEEITKEDLMKMINELKKENKELKKAKQEITDWNRRNLTV